MFCDNAVVIAWCSLMTLRRDDGSSMVLADGSCDDGSCDDGS